VTVVSIEPECQIWVIKHSIQVMASMKVGDMVVWTNNDPVIHITVEGSPPFPSPESIIRPEDSTTSAEFKSGFLSQGMTFKHPLINLEHLIIIAAYILQ
jgi:hypothetical protein